MQSRKDGTATAYGVPPIFHSSMYKVLRDLKQRQSSSNYIARTDYDIHCLCKIWPFSELRELELLLILYRTHKKYRASTSTNNTHGGVFLTVWCVCHDRIALQGNTNNVLVELRTTKNRTFNLCWVYSQKSANL